MKVGILGLGSIGHRHARNLIALGHTVIGYDPAKGQLRLEGLMHEDRDTILCKSDAIIIASPTTNHWEDLVDTKIANKPTFAEKPISASVASLHEKYPHVVMVGYNLRFHHVVRQVKAWLNQKRIGTPLWAHFVCAQHNEKPAYRRDGVILNWSHEIDLALYLLGHGNCVAAAKDQTESSAAIIIKHDFGCQTTIHLDYVTSPEQRYFHLTGTEGTIHANLAPDREAIWSAANNHVPWWAEDYHTEEFSATDTYDENYVDEMRAFIDRIEGKETIGATCHDGLDVLEICLDAKFGKWQG